MHVKPGGTEARRERSISATEDREPCWSGGVTCLSFSPFFIKHFLAGCSDGSVRLYKVRTDECKP